MTSAGPLDTSDADLLRAHVDGDPDAFAELVRRHRDRLWAVALRTIGDREEAADGAVQAFDLEEPPDDAALDALAAADGDVSPELLRAVIGPAGDAEAGAPAQDHDPALVVRPALAELPAEQRAALVLVDVQGYPVAEAAEILGVAEGTIKSRCARGRARMAITLGHLRRGDDGHPAAGNHKEHRNVSSGSASATTAEGRER